MLLSAADFRRFNDIVRLFYVPQSEGDLRKTVAARMLDIIPGVNAWVSDLDLKRMAIVTPEGTHSVLSQELLDMAPELLPFHPLGECLVSAEAVNCSISDMVSRGAWHRNPVYNAFYRPEGFEDQLCSCFHFRGARCTSVAVLRDRRGFDEKDRMLMAMLRPHLDQAFRNASRFAFAAIPVPETPGTLAGTSPTPFALSPREAEVLHWITQGKRNEEIAVILSLSIHTVKNHAKRIFARLGVETRTAAAAVAARYASVAEAALPG